MKKTAEEIIEESGFVHISKAEDRILYYDDVMDLMERYALEAIKADRERVAEKAKVKKVATHVGNYHEVDKQSILNIPIELP